MSIMCLIFKIFHTTNKQCCQYKLNKSILYYIWSKRFTFIRRKCASHILGGNSRQTVNFLECETRLWLLLPVFYIGGSEKEIKLKNFLVVRFAVHAESSFSNYKAWELLTPLKHLFDSSDCLAWVSHCIAQIISHFIQMHNSTILETTV